MREVLGWLAVAAVLLVAAFYLVPVGAIALIMGADSTPEDCLRADRDELVALVADAPWAQSPPSSVERKPVVRGASQFYMGCRVELRFVTDAPRTEQARLTDWGKRSGYEFPPGRTDEIRALGDGIVRPAQRACQRG